MLHKIKDIESWDVRFEPKAIQNFSGFSFHDRIIILKKIYSMANGNIFPEKNC